MHLVTDTGETVRSGTVLIAVVGPHTGRRFRFVDIHESGERVLVRHAHGHTFRNALAVLHPSVFACEIHQELTRLRRTLNLCHHTWQKVDEGLVMGALALVPLALFEAYGGGEKAHELLASLLGGG
jgi:hypothetical protein